MAHITNFYRKDDALMAHVILDKDNTVELEIERYFPAVGSVKAYTVKNEKAYTEFSREIADYKAKNAPKTEPVKHGVIMNRPASAKSVEHEPAPAPRGRSPRHDDERDE